MEIKNILIFIILIGILISVYMKFNKWKCIHGTCIPSFTGIYDTQESCINNCNLNSISTSKSKFTPENNNQISYNCYNGQCIQLSDNSGDYSNANSCYRNCLNTQISYPYPLYYNHSFESPNNNYHHRFFNNHYGTSKQNHFEQPILPNLSISTNYHPTLSNSLKYVPQQNSSIPLNVLQPSSSIPLNVPQQNSSIPLNVLQPSSSIPLDVLQPSSSIPLNVHQQNSSIPLDVLQPSSSILQPSSSDLLPVLQTSMIEMFSY